MKSKILFVALFLFVIAVQARNIALQSDITTVEPLKGIVLWGDNEKMNTLQNSIKLEFAYCLPCEVVSSGEVSGKITYDWSSLETTLNAIKERGHQAILRFRLEYPSYTTTGISTCECNIKGATAVPNYIKSISGYTETYAKNPGGDGPTYYADWSNTELLRFYKQFYTDFAEKYDNDPRIAFVQAGFGHWGEYHTYGTDPIFGKNFPTKVYQVEFFKHLASVFSKTPWSISIDAADDAYTPYTESADFQGLRFGLFDDSFMHEEHDKSQGDGWNEQCWIAMDGVSTRWKTGPCGGEISYYTDDDQHNFLNPSGMYGVTWEQAATKYHMTYVIGNDATEGSYATATRVKEASQNSGYKFEITAYSVTSNTATVKVKNIGIAPIYHDAYVTVKNMRSATSLKGLLPGEECICIVTGLTIESFEEPALTITSDKILSGTTIPYKANLLASSISETNAISTVVVRPNEVQVTVAEKADVDIFTMQGNLITSHKNSTAINEKMPAGLYIINIKTVNGMQSEKVLIP